MEGDTGTDTGIHVDPIRSLDDVRRVKELLAGRPRDLLLFSLGINNGARAGDLLRVTVNEVRDAQPGCLVPIREKRGRGTIPLAFHDGTCRLLRDHLQHLSPPPSPANMYLFASRRGWTPLKTQDLDHMVREWTAAADLTGRFGAHTLRKTFGYLQYSVFGVGMEVLAPRFGHASGAVTARYLGINGGATPEPRLREL